MRFLIVSISLLATSVWADDPPQGFSDHLQPLLTPLEVVDQLPAGPNGVAGKEPDGEFLLGEYLYRVEADGTQLALRHLMIKPLTEDGVDFARERSIAYRKNDQRAWLLSGKTKHPERGDLPVSEGAVFTEKVGDASSDIHSDGERLKAIFPDVVAGSIVDSLFGVEIHRPTFPNEFGLYKPIGHISPMRRQRIVVDLPAEMAQRLRWHVVGAREIDEPKRTEIGGGRVQLEWIIDRIAPIVFEKKMPALHQTGPYITMTTMPDWGALGHWFADFLEEPDEDESRELQAVAEEWGGKSDADDKRAIAAALYEKVRDEVRYTGLEFGKGAFCPRGPNAVLDTKFGDCKDKSNLLRALLARRGIDSRMALVSTKHDGHLERTLPSTRCFNHAILAVDLGDDAPVFCDPTLVGVPFGILSSGGADREALLVDSSGEIEWLQTPRQPDNKSEISVDLTLEPGGGFCGWVDYKARGYLAGRFHAVVGADDRAGILQFLSKLTGGLGGKAIDYEVLSWDRQTSDLHFKFYVLKVGAPLSQAGKRERVPFPAMSMLFPQVGDERQRQTSIFRRNNEAQMSVRFRLPEDWVVVDSPEDFSGEAAGFSFESSWKEEEQSLISTAASTQEGGVVSAIDHARLWDLERRMFDWVGSPTLCKRTRDEDEAYDDDPWRPASEDLPDLPNPEGHQALIDARYPLDLNNLMLAGYSGRKAAFERMAKSFPDNAEVQFDAGLAAIYCDVLDMEFAGTAARTLALVERWRPFLSPGKVALAELGLAGTLTVEERFDEALPIALRLQQDEGVNLRLRQAAAGIVAGAQFQLGDIAPALEMATMAMELKVVPPESTYSLTLVQLHGTLKLAAEEAKAEELESMWFQISGQRPDLIEVMREIFVELPEYLLGLGEHQNAKVALEVLVKLFTSNETAWGGSEMAELLEQFEESQVTAERARPFVARLQAWLEKSPWPELDKLEEEDFFETALDLELLADEYFDYPDIHARYLLRSLVECGPQAEFFESITYLAASLNDWFNSHALDDDPDVPEPPATAETLIDFLLEVHRDSLDAQELATGKHRLLEAEVKMRRDGEAAGLAAYEAIAADATCSSETRGAAISDIAYSYMWENHQKFLQTTDRLSAAEFAEQGLDNQFLICAAYLALELDRPAEAWRRFELIAASEPEDFGWRLPEKLHAIIKAQVAELSDGDALRKIGEPDWLADWQQLGSDLGLPQDSPDLVLAAIDDELVEPEAGLAEFIEAEEIDEHIADFVRTVVNLARWHPALRPEAAAMLRGPACGHWPDQAEKLEAIAGQMEK